MINGIVTKGFLGHYPVKSNRENGQVVEQKLQ